MSVEENVMAIYKQRKRLLGQILLDGGFLSRHDLELALADQRQTNDLLGQILVRMGVLDEAEIRAALSIQERVSNLEDATKSAAGMRQLLGSLLIMAGRITNDQLEHAIREQKASGEKLGEVLIRQGLLKEEQLHHFLTYQQNQSDGKRLPNPFRIGEILVTTGYITRQQLDDALLKQASSAKKLGEVLIEEGYIAPNHVTHGIHLQKQLITAALTAIISLFGMSISGCGSDGAGYTNQPQEYSANIVNVNKPEKTIYLTATSDDYPLVQPTYYYSTLNEYFWSIQANVATAVFDVDSKCVVRIDIPITAAGLPSLNKTFSIVADAQHEAFPGIFLVINGKKSTNNKVESGFISFSSDTVAAERVSGSYDVIMTDYDSGSLPPPQHRIKGDFNFKMGEYGPADPV
jgi:hypothetical protein